MERTARRKVVVIDEEKCDGCGACIPSCAEGAMRVIDGKARLVDENLCDGLGHCLGACPRGAISVVEREERIAVAMPEARIPAAMPEARAREESRSAPACGCPGAAFRTLPGAAGRLASNAPAAHATDAAASPGAPVSLLSHWPVQLHLLPVESPMWSGADLLVAADCVGFAMPDFHSRLLAGRKLAVGCPKLDDIGAYARKLTAVFARHDVRSVTVARMEVPCCMGIVHAVREALAAAGRADVPVREVLVGVDGTILGDEADSEENR